MGICLPGPSVTAVSLLSTPVCVQYRPGLVTIALECNLKAGSMTGTPFLFCFGPYGLVSGDLFHTDLKELVEGSFCWGF